MWGAPMKRCQTFMTNVTRCLYFKSACLSNGAGVAKRAGPVEEWDPKGPSGTVCEQAHGVRRTPCPSPRPRKSGRK